MANLDIYIASDNLFVVEFYDTLGLLTVAEMQAATGTVTLYSDAAHSSAVSGASSLTLTAFADETAQPIRFYATIPNTVSLTKGSTYYAAGSLSATDASLGQTSKITFEEIVTAAYAT